MINFFFERERETSICHSTHSCTHWLTLPRDQTHNLGALGRGSSQLTYSAMAGASTCRLAGPRDGGVFLSLRFVWLWGCCFFASLINVASSVLSAQPRARQETGDAGIAMSAAQGGTGGGPPVKACILWGGGKGGPDPPTGGLPWPPLCPPL